LGRLTKEARKGEAVAREGGGIAHSYCMVYIQAKARALHLPGGNLYAPALGVCMGYN
jgi:hypothetical protein